MTVYFDLSQPIENGMTHYPGDPEPRLQPAEGIDLPWRVSELHFGTHTGTHIDAASHYITGGKTIDQYPLERFILSGICISLSGLNPDESIEVERITKFQPQILKGGALLLQTGWDRYWGKEQYFHHPYLSLSAARSLSEAGVSLLGIDALNIDSTAQGTSHAHEILLERDILIVENLTGLEQLKPGEIYRFACLPLLLARLDGSPVRAVAWRVE
ncbi:MAG: cyclase family protein [Omnitrophica WOR_2 bacterium]